MVAGIFCRCLGLETTIFNNYPRRERFGSRIAEESEEISKASFISGLVNPLGSKISIVGTFADDDFTGRPNDYWKDFEENVEAVTPDDVLEVAQKYLHPEQLIYLIVGDPEAVGQGSDRGGARQGPWGPARRHKAQDTEARDRQSTGGTQTRRKTKMKRGTRTGVRI